MILSSWFVAAVPTLATAEPVQAAGPGGQYSINYLV